MQGLGGLGLINKKTCMARGCPTTEATHEKYQMVRRLIELFFNLRSALILLLYYNGPNPYRYLIEGLPNASYTEQELKQV